MPLMDLSLPLVVVIDPKGCCAQDVPCTLGFCVFLTCRVVRGRLHRAKNNTVWFACHDNAGAQQRFWRVRSWCNTEAPNVWCTLECVSCESPVLAGWRTSVWTPACVIIHTVSFNEHTSSLSLAAATE